MTREAIIQAIDAYAAVSGLMQSTICQYALSHRRFYKNLSGGGNYEALTVERLMRWIKENPPEKFVRAS
jgi:hypothetical protein